MIRPEDILFWGGGNVLAKYGTLVRRTSPIAEPVVSFSRTSDAWTIGRSGRLRKVASHRPRVEWLDLDGDGVRETPTALLEQGATNLLSHSCDLSAGQTAWNDASNFSVSAATSIFASQTAWRHTNLNVASANRTQKIGTFSGQPETLSAIIENVDATHTDLNIRDNTAAMNVCIGRLTWATGQASVQSGAGTVLAQQLANAGPNGGPVYRLMVTGTGTAGNQRQIYLYPSGTSQNTQTVIVHHVQHEVGAVATSPIVTTTAAVTRSADVLTFPWSHAPQAMTIYLRFQERGTAALASASAAVWGLSGTGARLGVWGSSTYPGGYRVELVNHANQFISSHNPLAFGRYDMVELWIWIRPDGSVRLDAAKNGGAVVQGDESVVPASGLPPAWGAPVQYIGARAAGNVGLSALRDVMVLRGADWTLDAVRRMVG